MRFWRCPPIKIAIVRPIVEEPPNQNSFIERIPSTHLDFSSLVCFDLWSNGHCATFW